MKFSLNLAQYYSVVDFKSIPHREIIKRIGAQLGAVEDYTDWSSIYDGIVIAKILSCEKHPNADKLQVCEIDDRGVTKDVERNERGNVQVVCGAPNARAGLLVAWLPPGTIVPTSRFENEPFELSVRDIRGVVSNGMLASSKELAVGDDHDGILEVDKDSEFSNINPGDSLSQVLNLDDFVIDCENKMFTHRPDCFGNIGITRELVGICGMKFESPDWYLSRTQEASYLETTPYEVTNRIPDLVPRFMTQYIEGVRVGKGPTWRQALLKRIGIKSVNSIVDISNYYMHLTAQPTHAFDYDKLVRLAGVQSIELAPRLANEGERLTVLGGKQITLSKDDIVIACNDIPIALAGVIGGAESEVDINTKNLVVECATFDMYAIRRTAMRHGLFTDAVTRYNKGQSPRQNAVVLAKITSDICSETSGRAAIATDTNPELTNNHYKSLDVTVAFVNTRLGCDIAATEMQKILENVEFDVELADDVLKIQVPFWRMDVSIPEDIVEEVGRLYGYGKVRAVLPARSSKPAAKNKSIEIKKDIRNILSRAGANEVLTYSFVHGGLIDKVGQDKQQAYHLRNAISPDLQYYRISLTPSLLAKVNANIRSGCDDFAIFEIGKAHIKNHNDSDGLPKEFERLSFVVASSVDRPDSAYFTAKNFLVNLLNQLEVNSTTVFTTQDSPERDSVDQAATYYQPGRSAVVSLDGEVIGRVGEYNVEVCKALKLPSFCAGFEISTEILGRHISGSANYSPISKYPSIHQDISLRVRLDVSYQQLHDILLQEIDTKKEDHAEVKITPIDIYQGDDHEYKNFAFRLSLVSHIRTLTTEEVNTLLDNIANRAHELCGAVRL
jgi:phenylalanyl-tRNA synthetase beta chain